MMERKVVLKLKGIDSRKKFMFVVIGWIYIILDTLSLSIDRKNS